MNEIHENSVAIATITTISTIGIIVYTKRDKIGLKLLKWVTNIQYKIKSKIGKTVEDKEPNEILSAYLIDSSTDLKIDITEYLQLNFSKNLSVKDVIDHFKCECDINSVYINLMDSDINDYSFGYYDSISLPSIEQQNCTQSDIKKEQ